MSLPPSLLAVTRQARRPRGHTPWRKCAILYLAAIALHVPAQVHAQAGGKNLRWSLKLEAGSEYDTNVHRFEVAGDAPDGTSALLEAAPLARSGARLHLAWPLANRHRMSTIVFGGIKLYGTDSAQDENVAIVAADSRYQWNLAERRAVLGVRGSYYDALGYQLADREPVVDPRHFSTLGSELSLTLFGPDEHRLILTAGQRRFDYKPSASFNWTGPVLGMRYQTTTWRGNPDTDLDAAAIDIALSYEVERRSYQSDALTNICSVLLAPRPQCVAPVAGMGRADLHHAAAAELLYTGDRMYSARYELDVTDSNSFGQSLVRQRLELGMTTELIARIFLTAKAAIQLDIFVDSLLLARDISAEDFTTIDDENRNSLSAHLARDITDAWTVEGRYVLFTNEFATRESTFRRQVFYVGVVYHYQP